MQPQHQWLGNDDSPRFLCCSWVIVITILFIVKYAFFFFSKKKTLFINNLNSVFCNYVKLFLTHIMDINYFLYTFLYFIILFIEKWAMLFIPKESRENPAKISWAVIYFVFFLNCIHDFHVFRKWKNLIGQKLLVILSGWIALLLF